MTDRAYTIEFVLDCESGETIHANWIFKQTESFIFQKRRELEDAINGRRPPKYTCYLCGQLLKIRGRPGSKVKRMHFAHLQDSAECPIKTGKEYSKDQIEALKYNGQKESMLHIATKESIVNSLRLAIEAGKHISNIKVETIKRDESGILNWKKPDVSIEYIDKYIVFEIQLSTTFLSVIADREYFYSQNKTYIIWIFKYFNIEMNNSRFTELDVFYSNNQNAFIYDDEATYESTHRKELILKCIYIKPYIENKQIISKIIQEFVSLDQLFFENESYKVYYFDYNKKYKELEAEILEIEYQEKLEKETKEKLEREKLEFKNREWNLKRYNGFEKAKVLIRKTIQEMKINGNLTQLLNLFYNFSDNTFYQISVLFTERKFYNISKEEVIFLNKIYKSETEDRTHLEREDLLTSTCWAICMIKLNTLEKRKRARRIQTSLFKIISISIGYVIGHAYSTLLQVAHTVKFQNNTYAHIFIKTLMIKQPKLLEEDIKAGSKLIKKIDKFNNEVLQHDNSCNDLFTILTNIKF